MEEKEKKEEYIRIGVAYYKIVQKPSISRDKSNVLMKWNRETIVTDHGRKFLDKIPKYDGFCCIPNHINYEKEIDGFYNRYSEIPHLPIDKSVTKEKIPFSLDFVNHIFGSQAELGLDYLKVLLENPTQILPILCLVSKERATGKSTFIKWLKEIFGLNMTYIKGDSFGSQFNADWASMLIVAIDEVFFDRKEITERLKYLSTTNKDKVEAKGKDREEIDFFAKFILCSNNEETFIQIDENEIRFWVRKIKPIKKENIEFLSQLTEEIPYFLKYLTDRPFFSERKTRMWFSPSEIMTKALQKLISKSNLLETKIIECLYEFFENKEQKEIHVVPQDLLNMVSKMFRLKYFTRNDVRKILKEKWKLTPEQNALAYTRHDIDYTGNFYETYVKGRYFTIKKDFILQKYDDLLN